MSGESNLTALEPETDVRAAYTAAAPVLSRPTTTRHWRFHVALALIMLVSGVATYAASLRNSTTFDEIVLIAGGARGWETGRFDLAPDHPPLMQYLYGLPVFLSQPAWPDESTIPADVITSVGYRYLYSQLFFWRSGNDPERLAALGRLPAVLIASLLVALVYAFLWKRHDPTTAILGAALTAFLPDVLAHGGVAYNDVPLAAAFFGAVWAVDAAVRRPGTARAALAGFAIAITIAVKISGVIIAPVALAIVAAEATRRYREPAWRAAIIRSSALVALSAYIALALLLGGDWQLQGALTAVTAKLQHAEQGHGVASYLLGHRNAGGWWFFFPVAFLFKTSAGLHFLALMALLGYVRHRSPGRLSILWSENRAMLLGLVIFGAVLIMSNLHIGFRYALPVLPLIVALVAPGAMLMVRRSGLRWVRAAVLLATVWCAGSSLIFYPDFLTYISEYGPGRDRGHEVLVDSSLDWGQGLLALRDFLEERGNPPIILSYFGSALPEGYGIDYAPFASFFPLGFPPGHDPARQPEYLVVSATNLEGIYITDDRFARLRDIEPARVIAGTLLVYPWSAPEVK